MPLDRTRTERSFGITPTATTTEGAAVQLGGSACARTQARVTECDERGRWSPPTRRGMPGPGGHHWAQARRRCQPALAVSGTSPPGRTHYMRHVSAFAVDELA